MPRRWEGACRGSSARPGSGPWPSARSLPTPGTDEDLYILDIHLSCRLSVKSIRGQPVDRPAPAPTYALDLTRGGSFPLSAVTSVRLPQVTFAPGSSTDRGKTPVPTATGPAPGTYHQGPPTRQRVGLGCVSQVPGAILTPAPVSTLQIGQAPNSSFLVSMYWQINGTGAHTPPR